MYTPVNEHSNGKWTLNEDVFPIEKMGIFQPEGIHRVWDLAANGLGSLGYVSFQQPEALDASGTVIGRLAPEACSGWVNR